MDYYPYLNEKKIPDNSDTNGCSDLAKRVTHQLIESYLLRYQGGCPSITPPASITPPRFEGSSELGGGLSKRTTLGGLPLYRDYTQKTVSRHAPIIRIDVLQLIRPNIYILKFSRACGALFFSSRACGAQILSSNHLPIGRAALFCRGQLQRRIPPSIALPIGRAALHCS